MSEFFESDCDMDRALKSRDKNIREFSKKWYEQIVIRGRSRMDLSHERNPKMMKRAIFYDLEMRKSNDDNITNCFGHFAENAKISSVINAIKWLIILWSKFTNETRKKRMNVRRIFLLCLVDGRLCMAFSNIAKSFVTNSISNHKKY